MNWFDYLLLGIIAFYFIGGLIQGVLKQLFSLFGFFIALALALMGSRSLGGYGAALLKPEYFVPYEEVLQRIGIALTPEGMMELAGSALIFLVLLALLLILFQLLIHWATKVNKVPVLGFFNRLAGALFGLLMGLLIGFALINAALLLPLPFLDDALGGSLVAGYMELYLLPLFAGLKEVFIDFLLRGGSGGIQERTFEWIWITGK